MEDKKKKEQEEIRAARMKFCEELRQESRAFRGKGGYVAYGGTPYCSWECFRPGNYTKGGR